jgi:hypothetical protein
MIKVKQIIEYKTSLHVLTSATILVLNLFSISAVAQETSLSKFNSLSQQESIIINGIVIDKQTKEFLPFVTVTYYQKTIPINTDTTDFNGEFKIKIDTSNYVLNGSYLRVIATGFKTDIIKLTNFKKNIIEIESLVLDSTVQSIDCRWSLPEYENPSNKRK